MKIILNIFNFLFKGAIKPGKIGAKFLKKSEIKKFLSPGNKGLLLDGNNLRLTEKESCQNVCLTARVGAGKTTKYIISNVLDKASQEVSLVIHDPKGEVYELTANHLKEQGFEVIVFNPQNVSSSNCFNPLTEAKNQLELEQVAETLIWSGNPSEKDAFWNNGAIRVLNPLIKCLSFGQEENFNLPNLYHLLQNFGTMGEGIEDWVSANCWDEKYPGDPYVLNEWKGALTGNTEAIQSFIGICLTSLRAMGNRELRQFFSKSDYDFSTLRESKTAIFFITPAEYQKFYAFTTSLFFRTIFNESMRKHHLTGKSLPLYILYDEFGNSYIPEFVSTANVLRGYGVSLSIILQSISQLAMRYGDKGAEAIQGAINTNICLSASDPVTANYFSDLSGRVRERQLKRDDKEQTDYREYCLLNSNEVRTIDENEALIISKNRNPVKLEVLPYFKNKKFLKCVKPIKTTEFLDRKITVNLVDLGEVTLQESPTKSIT